MHHTLKWEVPEKSLIFIGTGRDKLFAMTLRIGNDAEQIIIASWSETETERGNLFANPRLRHWYHRTLDNEGNPTGEKVRKPTTPSLVPSDDFQWMQSPHRPVILNLFQIRNHFCSFE